MADDDRVPKLCGADIELGNFILRSGPDGRHGRPRSRALLREIDAPYARSRLHSGLFDALAGARVPGYDPQDWGRKYLASNGGCAYIDLDHLECCSPRC